MIEQLMAVAEEIFEKHHVGNWREKLLLMYGVKNSINHFNTSLEKGDWMTAIFCPVHFDNLKEHIQIGICNVLASHYKSFYYYDGFHVKQAFRDGIYDKRLKETDKIIDKEEKYYISKTKSLKFK